MARARSEYGKLLSIKKTIIKVLQKQVLISLIKSDYFALNDLPIAEVFVEQKSAKTEVNSVEPSWN